MTDNQLKGIMSKKSDNWATPISFKNRIRYTLDPCPLNHDIEKWDGLEISWFDEIVFCNPPYSQLSIWVDKIIYELDNGCLQVKLLVPSRTDTKWFHKLVDSGYLVKITFIQDRLRFK